MQNVALRKELLLTGGIGAVTLIEQPRVGSGVEQLTRHQHVSLPRRKRDSARVVLYLDDHRAQHARLDFRARRRIGLRARQIGLRAGAHSRRVPRPSGAGHAGPAQRRHCLRHGSRAADLTCD